LSSIWGGEKPPLKGGGSLKSEKGVGGKKFGPGVSFRGHRRPKAKISWKGRQCHRGRIRGRGDIEKKNCSAVP